MILFLNYMKIKIMAQLAVMNIEKGEEIVIGLVSGIISGSGRYKFLAKKTKAGKYEWAHFVERDSGLKEKVYRGETKNMEELKTVLEIMNRNLVKIFGANAEMKEGIPEFRSLMGKKFDDTVN
jgi:predicted house-cleaning noncanonical NTP pyrophosphatase (MazG superfamily)